MIADILGTPYDPSKEYVLHIIDRGENLDQFGQNTLVPTWDNMQGPTQKYLGGKHESKILAEVMTPEYQKRYAEDIRAYKGFGLGEFNDADQQFYAESLPPAEEIKFMARHDVRREIGANSEFTGNGLTQSREPSTQFGVVETLTLENNPSKAKGSYQMSKNTTKDALGLIDVNNLNADEKFLFSINYEMFPDKETKIYKKGNYLVVNSESWNPIKRIRVSNQCELPLKAISWIVDRFENGFLKPESQGGISDFERSLRKDFDDEIIGINAMAHCCAENMPGFNIWNASRKSYIAKSSVQQWDIPRQMLLEQGLLTRLKVLAEDIRQGKL